MRKTLLTSLSFIVLASGAAAQTPQDRFNGGRGTRPTPVRPAAVPQAAVSDQGITGPIHEAHKGGIVFTRSDLALGGISEGAFVKDFTLGQPMFFRVFLERSAVNHLAMRGGVPAGSVYADGVMYKARFTVSGQVIETSFGAWGGITQHSNWTTWRGHFINPDLRMALPGSEVMRELLARGTGAGLFAPGVWPVTMEVVPVGQTQSQQPLMGDVIARGSFNLTVPEGAFNPANPLICVPGRGAAGSAAIEARTMAVSKASWHEQGTTPVRAIAIGEDWVVKRNEITGIPIERETKVLVLARGPKFCTTHVHEFTEQHIGGGKYATATGGVSNRVQRGYVPCACLG